MPGQSTWLRHANETWPIQGITLTPVKWPANHRRHNCNMSTLVLLPAQVLDREQGRSLSHPTDDVATQACLVSALRNAVACGVGEKRIAVLETHISYVFLTGEFGYQIKKAG